MFRYIYLLTSSCLLVLVGCSELDFQTSSKNINKYSTSVPVKQLNALSRNPTDAKLHYEVGLGYIGEKTGNYFQLADAAFETAYRLDPKEPQILKSLASTQYSQGNFDVSMLLLGRLAYLRNLSTSEQIIFSAVAYRAGYFEVSKAIYNSIDIKKVQTQAFDNLELYEFLTSAFDGAADIEAIKFGAGEKTSRSQENLPEWTQTDPVEELFIDAVIVEHSISSKKATGNNILENVALTIARGRNKASNTTSDSSGLSYTVTTLNNVFDYDLFQNIQYNLNLFKDTASRIHIQSSPNVLARVGETSSVTRTTTVTSLREYSSGGYTDFQPTEAGIVLRVTPMQLTPDYVDLSIEIENASFQQISTEVYLGLNNSPALQTEKVNTSLKAIVPFGEIISVGGVSSGVSLENNSGTRVLSKIPGVGSLFGQVTSEDTYTNTLVFLSAEKKEKDLSEIDIKAFLNEIGLESKAVDKIGQIPSSLPSISFEMFAN